MKIRYRFPFWLMCALLGCTSSLLAFDRDALFDGITATNQGNFEKAIKLLRQPAEEGEQSAQFYLALAFAKSSPPERDFTQAHEWFGRAAESGHADSQYLLGMMYRRGDGVDKDPVQAFKWLTVASDAKVLRANFALGEMQRQKEITEEQAKEGTRLAREWQVARRPREEQ